jgi:hypothetical protein
MDQPNRPRHRKLRQPGLERRMGREARRISSQHRQLDDLYGLVAQGLAEGDPPGTRVAFQRFADALDAHFSLEDGLYFPALHGLRPELGEPLAELAREHVRLREEVAGVQECLDRDDLDAAGSALDRLISDLARHEGVEERLLADLTPVPGGGR